VAEGARAAEGEAAQEEEGRGLRMLSLPYLPPAFFLILYSSQITRHVAQIIQRQEFILKLVRALMMCVVPSFFSIVLRADH
jgi:hypothetical protein